MEGVMRLRFVALAFACCVSVTAQAAPEPVTPITVKFQVNIDRAYDYVSGSYVSITPISGIGSFTFDLAHSTTFDYGSTTITQFGDVLGTRWSSPVTAHIPGDPYSGVYGPFYNSYAFPHVTDYPDTFIEQAAAQANTFWFDGTDRYAYYHIELRADKRSSPRNGDGTSDYAFSKEGLLTLLREFEATGAPVYFNESYARYAGNVAPVVYSEGRSWEDYNARIINIIEPAASIPEPASYALLLAGIALITLVARRSRLRA
jgi:hypothetical protein